MQGRTLPSKTNQEEVKGTYRQDRGEEEDGPQGKRGRGTARVWVRPLFVHDENDRLVWCSPPSSAGATRKKRGSTLRA